MARFHNVFFAANGFGPYLCHFCDKQDVSFDEVHVHHLDHDRANSVLENLVAAHPACHLRYHAHVNGPPPSQKGVPKTTEHREAISRSMKGRKDSLSAEARRIVTDGNRGLTRTVQQKQNISAGLRAASNFTGRDHAEDIARRYKTGERVSDLAAEYGVSRAWIYRLVKDGASKTET